MEAEIVIASLLKSVIILMDYINKNDIILDAEDKEELINTNSLAELWAFDKFKGGDNNKDE